MVPDEVARIGRGDMDEAEAGRAAGIDLTTDCRPRVPNRGSGTDRSAGRPGAVEADDRPPELEAADLAGDDLAEQG